MIESWAGRFCILELICTQILFPPLIFLFFKRSQAFWLRVFCCAYVLFNLIGVALWLCRYDHVDSRYASSLKLAHYYSSQAMKLLSDHLCGCPQIDARHHDLRFLGFDHLDIYVLNARPPSDLSALRFNQMLIKEANLNPRPLFHRQPRIRLHVYSTSYNLHNGTDVVLDAPSTELPQHCIESLQFEQEVSKLFEHQLFWQYLQLFRRLLAAYPHHDYYFLLEDDVQVTNLTMLLIEYAVVTATFNPQLYSFFKSASQTGHATCLYDSGTCGFIIRKDMVELILELADNGSFNRCDLPPIDLFLAQFVSHQTTNKFLFHTGSRFFR